VNFDKLAMRYILTRESVGESLYLQLLGAFAKLRKSTVSFVIPVCPSVRPRGTTRLPLDGFPCNLMAEYFPKICRENPSGLKKRAVFYL
jgi:hypothetical protein